MDKATASMRLTDEWRLVKRDLERVHERFAARATRLVDRFDDEFERDQLGPTWDDWRSYRSALAEIERLRPRLERFFRDALAARD